MYLKNSLIRWTIGPVNDNGFACLKHSINKIKNLYPECDLLICHNQLSESQIILIKQWNIPLFDQNDYKKLFTIDIKKGYQVHWKLYPPRITTNKHEIVIDNDIVIFKRLKEIDEFLNSDSTLMCQGLNGLHGKFNKYIPTGLRINSGLYGMPPNFDFNKILNETIPKFELNSWEGTFDEQGLIASVLNNYKKRIFIPTTTIPILESHFNLNGLTTDACCGYHFVGLNVKEDHQSWKNYKSRIII